jgi:hypothetical protein
VSNLCRWELDEVFHSLFIAFLLRSLTILEANLAINRIPRHFFFCSDLLPVVGVRKLCTEELVDPERQDPLLVFFSSSLLWHPAGVAILSWVAIYFFSDLVLVLLVDALFFTTII